MLRYIRSIAAICANGGRKEEQSIRIGFMGYEREQHARLRCQSKIKSIKSEQIAQRLPDYTPFHQNKPQTFPTARFN